MLDLTYVLNKLAGTVGLPEGRALDAAAGPYPGDTGWLPMTPLISTWVVYEVGGATWAEPAYRRRNGRVQFRGLIKNGGTTNNIFVLPAGFRPAKSCLFGVPSNLCMLRIDVTPDGTVLSNGVIAGTPDTSWTSLFPITYIAEQ